MPSRQRAAAGLASQQLTQGQDTRVAGLLGRSSARRKILEFWRVLA
jgi:hypothetical protein